MKSNGLKVIHIFHQHEDFKWLDKLSASSDYIGISPANDQSVKVRTIWLEKVFSRLPKGIKTHCFGLTAAKVMKLFPFFSCDSSSWLVGARYGIKLVWNGNTLQTTSKRSHNKKTLNRLQCYKMNGQEFNKANILETLKFQNYISKLWEARNLKFY